ncbi:hypothetical protein CVD25_05760 [Bacillus canaveralius]|uniref:S1 motif domain-containing protein n=1 Tax=Bacillus canaveralius TaxID=1403243 RepID=A0A2N5GKK5_9BACI|nr:MULTISPECIES: S1-like domain-containing RNA-binding protein [Bacillus]PLR81988.1 hypothetical protein CU635_12465 [Bacillus canaveralius]PLR87391.1 hypothetical protein CVD23_03160 [Bacillus sp. V33-4]PLR99374.1 hypothetical protein CVD25_05760 [Bacillus canaveralius]RSK46906.1 hypothetical protein EJA13_18905 [Bacillus canaveralius]
MSLTENLGRTALLKVARTSEFGFFLTDGEEDVLLHKNEAKQSYEEGDELEVFLYTDSQGRIAAADKIPAIQVERYEWVPVTDVNPGLGVFLDIGIQKELLLGEEDLPAHKGVWPKQGDLVYATIRVNRNNRLYARLATDKVFEEIAVKAGNEDFNKNIQGHIYRTAKVGSWIYTADGFKGFIHESQRGREPRLGERVEGRIIDVKADGTVNVSLLKRKHDVMDQDAETVLAYLVSRNGAMPYWDKSLPDEITERFQMSKAAFKRALGKLIKEDMIYQEEGWTYLKKDEDRQSK